MVAIVRIIDSLMIDDQIGEAHLKAQTSCLFTQVLVAKTLSKVECD